MEATDWILVVRIVSLTLGLSLLAVGTGAPGRTLAVLRDSRSRRRPAQARRSASAPTPSAPLSAVVAGPGWGVTVATPSAPAGEEDPYLGSPAPTWQGSAAPTPRGLEACPPPAPAPTPSRFSELQARLERAREERLQAGEAPDQTLTRLQSSVHQTLHSVQAWVDEQPLEAPQPVFPQPSPAPRERAPSASPPAPEPTPAEPGGTMKLRLRPGLIERARSPQSDQLERVACLLEEAARLLRSYDSTSARNASA